MSPVTSFPVENWKDHVPGPQLVVPRLQPAWKNDVRKIKLWVYSLMQPGYAECKDEYKISKWLLLQFVCSAAILQTVGDRLYIVLAMLRFRQGHVFMHEALYLHYLRQELRHYGAAHGTPHEVRRTI